MRRKFGQPPAWIDPSILYSRQEIGERACLADDVLSFWIRRKLLVPEPQEGSGKGVHHRFHYSQVGIAVILKALRDHFGANIGTLKSLADVLQDAVRLFRRSKAPTDTWMAATRLGDKLGRFRNGEEVEVLLFVPGDGFPGDGFRSEHRAASSEAEIVADSLQVSDGNPSDIIQLAEMLGPGRNRDYEIALAVLGTPLNPRYAGNNYWLLANKDGDWTIRNDSDDGLRDRSDIGPAMFLPVYSMLREAWGIPSGLRALDQAKRLEMVLADAGITCKITPSEDGESARIEAPDADMAEVNRIIDHYNTFESVLEKQGKKPLSEKYGDVYWTPGDEAAGAAA